MIYECKECNFVAIKKSRYDIHLTTKKHLKLFKKYEKLDINKYKCLDCNKILKSLNGIYSHVKKNHLIDNEINKCDNKNEEKCEYKYIIKKLEKQNTELFNMIKELSIQKSNIHIETTNTNSNNKTLNYQNITNYLNDKCADALNVEDFIPMIEVTLNDMLKISNNNMKRKDAIKMILEDNLNKLDFDKQPFKCSDIKRKKIYARTGGAWINDEEYKQTKKVFRHINNKAAMKSEEPHTKEILEETDMSSYELRKPLSYGCTDFEIEKCIESEKRILSEVTYYKNEE